MFTTQPLFQDSVDQILSAGDLDILRQNAALVDQLSYRQTVGFDSSSGGGTPTPGAYPTAHPFRIWKGYFRFRTGMTTLTIKGRVDFTSGVSLKVYLNGSGTASATISSPQTSFTQAITISGLGYTDGQIVPIEITTSGSGSVATANCVLTDIYAGPISLSGWPGVPTFTAATINASKLNQLADAIEWCYDRMNVVPILPQRGALRQLGAFRNGSSPIWYGSVLRAHSQDQLRLTGYITNITSTSARYKVYLDQALVYTSSTFGPGSYTIDLTQSLSGVSVGSAAEVSLHYEVVDQGPDAPWRQPRISLRYAMTSPTGGTYPAATLPTAFAAGSLSVTTLVSRLNTLASLVSAVKTRIDAAPHLWERARALRTWYGWSEDTRGVLPQRAPIHFDRRGSRLVVRGKDVKIAWGSVNTPMHEKGFLDYDAYEFSNSEQIIDSDRVDTREVYLDSFAGIYPSRQYFLVGDVYYAEELLD